MRRQQDDSKIYYSFHIYPKPSSDFLSVFAFSVSFSFSQEFLWECKFKLTSL